VHRVARTCNSPCATPGVAQDPAGGTAPARALDATKPRVSALFYLTPKRNIVDARFRSVLGACGMHGAVGAGRRRRRSREQSYSRPVVIQAAEVPLGRARRTQGRHIMSRRSAGAGTRAPSWRCARPGARRLAPAWTTLMALAREARARTPLRPGPRGSGVDWLSERSTEFSTRQRAAGDSNAGARHPHGSCTARSFCPLLSRDEHNCSSRNSWPQTLLSAHIAHGTLTRPHCAHTVEERRIERSAASLDTHSHARRSQSSARSARPVWRARARRCVRASQQLGQRLGPCARARRHCGWPPHGTFPRARR